MKGKFFLIFLCNFVCISAADDQFYLHDDFVVNLDFDYVQGDNELLLGGWQQEFDPINNFFDNISTRELVEKIIGKNVKNDNTPLENLTETIHSWHDSMSPEEFIDIFAIINNIATSDTYNHIPELQSACHDMTEFIVTFIKMKPNFSRDQYVVDHAGAWQEWVTTMHKYL